MTAAAGSDLAARSATGAVWTLVSRATGFARVAAAAAVLGPTFLGNTFQAVNTVPNLLFYLLAGSLVSSLLVPALTRQLDGGGPVAASRVAGGFMGVAVPLMVGVAALGAAAVPLVTRSLTSGIADPDAAADQRRAATLLLLLVLPLVVLYGVAAVGAAAQQAAGRFGLPAAAPAGENLALLVTLAVAAATGVGDDGSVPTAVVVTLGLGSTSAVALHAAIQVAGAARAGISVRPRAGWRDDDVRSVVALAVPSVGYAGANVVKEYALLVAAARVAGGVVAFQVGYAFYNLVGAIGARTVGTAALSDLARAADDDTRFGDELRRALALTVSLVVPAGVAAVALAGPLAGLVTFGEMDTGAGRRLVTLSLLGVGAGIVFDGTFSVLAGAAYARRRATGAVVAMVLRAAVTCAGLVVAVAMLEGGELLAGVGLAVVAGDVAGTAALARGVPRPGAGPARVGPAVARAVVASAALVVPAVVVAAAVQDAVGRRGAALVASAVGAAVCIGVLAALRSPELQAIVGAVRPRRVQPS